MHDLSFGHILQRMHVRSRVKAWIRENGRPPVFVEIGSGTGWLSQVLLDLGCNGYGFDLNQQACEVNITRNSTYIGKNHYQVHNGEFDPDKVHGSVDIFLSCMVFEHLENTVIQHIFSLARKKSTASSRYFVLVPAGMQFWGIEDDVAGHLRRYSMDEIAKLSTYLGVNVSHIAGLTYPLSNWLLGLSNFLVARKEGKLLALDQKQRTIESGLRDVEFKTRFPAWTLIFMNELVMTPFFWLQKIFKNSKNSLVLYAEFNILP